MSCAPTHQLQVFQTRRHLAGARHTWRTYRFTVRGHIVSDMTVYHGTQRANAVQVSDWAHDKHNATDRREAARMLRTLRRKFTLGNRLHIGD